MAGLLDWVDPAREWWQARPQALSGLLGAAYQLATDPAARESAMARQPKPFTEESAKNAQAMAEGFWNPAGLLGTLKPQGGYKSAKEIMDAFEKERGVNSWISENPKRAEITLSQVIVPKENRGQGIGTEFMQDLIGYADQTGQRVFLSPATDFGATSVDRLKRFYKQFGFVENKGRNKDYTTRETMYRRPSKEGE